MPDYSPNIDTVTKEVTGLMLKIYDEYKKIQPNLDADYNKGAAAISYRLGLDYFATARDTLYQGRIISGGAAVRSAIENLADLFYVYRKPDKYPEAYVKSMEVFKSIMMSATNKTTNALAKSRELRQANRWTDTSIDDRVKAIGSGLVNMYDLMSYFSHPNPGSLTYISNKDIQEKQANLMKQANCMTALTLMKIVLDHSDISSIKVADLEKIASELGMQI